MAAKILSQRSHNVPGKLKITEWFFSVPLDHSKPSDTTIRLFARSAEKIEKPAEPVKDEKKHLPWFVFFQGGPGFGCRPSFGGIYSTILDKGYKVLLLDERGTGMSNTITAESLHKIGGPREQVDYLKLFRADNIVRDAEAVRKTLTEDYPDEKKKWSIMGQSFGGFCCINYISSFPESVKEVFTTGGLPPLINQPDSLYQRLCRRVIDRSRQYYEKFPEDVSRVQLLANYLSQNDVRTFSGGKLSSHRLRALGISFGFHGGFEDTHNLILRMINDMAVFDKLTRPTINEFDSKGSFDDAILYALLHEPCYLQGAAADWSAERTINDTREFDSLEDDSKEPIMFTSEMITHSMFEDYESLAAVKDTAELLAKESDWPALYDEAQLAKNEVPVYAAQFYDDLYVDFDYGMDTVKKIKNCKVYVTNTMYHDAVRSKPEQIMKELFALRDDTLD